MMTTNSSRSRNLATVARFAWATLACNVAVVLWGAYVRATGSGAGCGDKWPLCGGPIVGTSARAQTIIEFTHRMTSGVALVMVACLVVWCWRITVRGDWRRYSSALAALFMANEALLGAALVLLKHVARDKSAARVFYLCLHFGNTLLLLGTLALTAGWLSRGSGHFKLTRKPVAVAASLLATMAIGITGAIAALADTLFPATSLRESILEDFSPYAPRILHVRLLHPAVAVIAASYVVWLVGRSSRLRGRVSPLAMAVIVTVLVQIALGVANVLLLTPIWLQILHLLVGDVFWILLVLASADWMLEDASARPLPAESATISAVNAYM